MHQNEPGAIGQLVRILTVPMDEETRYYVQIVSEYAGSTFWSLEDELETVAEAQQRILDALRAGPENEYLLCFEAEQFELLDWQADSDHSSPHERSRSRDADQHPDTRPQIVDSRAKHRELPDCGTEAEGRTRQEASATPNFCATPPRTVPATPPRTVPATDKVTQQPKKRPRSRVSKPDSEAAQASTGLRMTRQDSP